MNFYTCMNNDCLRCIMSDRLLDECPHCGKETLAKFKNEDIDLENDKEAWEACLV